MANPIKGEVSFEADGKQYKFILGTYAMAAIERRSGKTYAQFFGRKSEAFGVDDLLITFHAGLLRHHDMTEREAGDLVDTIGMDAASKVINEAVQLASPPATTGGASRPQKADGPGPNS